MIPGLCLLAACSQPAQPTQAQSLPAPAMPEPDRRVPGDAMQMKLSFAPVVKRAAPAVVNVYSRRVVRQSLDPFWQMFGGGMGLPRERIAQSLGSGVIVRADGVIVTNNHVVEGGPISRSLRSTSAPSGCPCCPWTIATTPRSATSSWRSATRSGWARP
jgi:S1-C subfamily serine protease